MVHTFLTTLHAHQFTHISWRREAATPKQIEAKHRLNKASHQDSIGMAIMCRCSCLPCSTCAQNKIHSVETISDARARKIMSRCPSIAIEGRLARIPSPHDASITSRQHPRMPRYHHQNRLSRYPHSPMASSRLAIDSVSRPSYRHAIMPPRHHHAHTQDRLDELCGWTLQIRYSF